MVKLFGSLVRGRFSILGIKKKQEKSLPSSFEAQNECEMKLGHRSLNSSFRKRTSNATIFI